MSILKKLNKKGATAIEYALIIALVAVICLTAYKTLGQKIKEQVEKVSNEINTSNSSTT